MGWVEVWKGSKGSNISSLSNWKNKVAFYWSGEDQRRATAGGRKSIKGSVSDVPLRNHVFEPGLVWPTATWCFSPFSPSLPLSQKLNEILRERQRDRETLSLSEGGTVLWMWIQKLPKWEIVTLEPSVYGDGSREVKWAVPGMSVEGRDDRTLENGHIQENSFQVC